MKKKNRIISLLPAATEMVFFLGLEDSLVGVSHDSDYPPSVVSFPKLTGTTVSQNLTSEQIDETVRKTKHSGQSVFHIDDLLLSRLNPDLILTQELCSVCAPSYTQVSKAAKIVRGSYTLLSLEPESTIDILENIRTIGEYTGRFETAEIKIRTLTKQLENVRDKTEKIKKKPTTLIIEWLDPIMIAGHWIPEMIQIAGGTPLFAQKGERFRKITWNEIEKLNPDILIIAPCGFPIKRTKKELSLILRKPNFQNLTAVQTNNTFLMDGNAFLTRPGPRIIDGIEILAEIFYPHIFQRKYNVSAWQRIRF